MSKKLAIRRAFQSSDHSNEKENSPQTPSLKEYADNTGRKGGSAASHDALLAKDVAYGTGLGVTTPTVLAPVLRTLSAEPSNVVPPTTPQYSEANILAFNAEGLSKVSRDDSDMNGRPRSASTGSKKIRWIKHTLASGLVIEVEATKSNGLLPSLIETSDQPTLHRPIQATIKTPSPEPPQLESDDYYTHLEDWLLDPRQGGDGFFEQYIEDFRAQQELPFHQRTIWQETFIPTLLKFLGTRSDPWDFSGDAFIAVLPDIWLTVYHEPSWPDEDDALVHSLVSDSVIAWFESFASNALAAVEKFLKGSTDGSPCFSRWSERCEGMMRDYRACLDHPGGLGSSGIFSSMFVLAPLSGHLQAIHGGKQIEGAARSSDELEYPFGAIGLAAAAAFRAMQLFRAQLVRYDEDGKILVETPTGDTAEPHIGDAAFNRYTAEERTRRHSSFACNLPRYELDAILSQAHEFVLYLNHDEVNSVDEVLDYDDDEYGVA
ncbi:hypothetical protein GSI_04625 [Ganoderma sinense ZZ0214-1]|uniref:Uncharacterized protein n=1 Tax=Ganoderma sinense ZZ0214-1 TaxID=1077348 RepID=A0A2G8SHC7_9APHY|nr:hypothetical protein GSI_04625 [Ganoderma sinense ZZ0214-1]